VNIAGTPNVETSSPAVRIPNNTVAAQSLSGRGMLSKHGCTSPDGPMNTPATLRLTIPFDAGQ
jgi:hypothetical protein